MSTATELLRRALDDLELQVGRSIDEIRTFLAAETEAEYDFYGVIPLTHRKAKGIIKDNGYHVTGFVLSRPDGDKCIVDMSAVRWLTDKEFFEIMHPPVVSPTAEQSRKPMTEEEAIELCPFTREEFKVGFLTGIRFAEKHHGIGGDDE